MFMTTVIPSITKKVLITWIWGITGIKNSGFTAVFAGSINTVLVTDRKNVIVIILKPF